MNEKALTMSHKLLLGRMFEPTDKKFTFSLKSIKALLTKEDCPFEFSSCSTGHSSGDPHASWSETSS